MEQPDIAENASPTSADEPSVMSGGAEWTWPDGALLIHHRYGTPKLVKVERDKFSHDKYGVHYLQFPEFGRPSGGSSWISDAKDFHEPTSFDELLDLHLYRTAERVRLALDELTIALADREAVRRHAEYHGRTIRRSDDPAISRSDS